MKAIWVREHAKAVQRYDDVVVLHCVGADRNLRRAWRMEPETDDGLGEGIPTYRMWYRPSRIPRISYLIYVWSVIRAFGELAKKGIRPAVIHVHVYDAGGPAVFLGKLKSIPVVVTEQFTSFPRRLLGPLDLFKAWLAFRGATVVLPVSCALQKAIERYGIRANFRVVPNVVDTTLFLPPSSCRNDRTPKRLLFVGQLVPVKGLPILLQALSRLRQKRKDWHLDIVGDGSGRAEYEHLAAVLQLCDAVRFHGLKTKQELAEFMRRSDLLVLPSLAETFSVPVAEALAVGLPVLSTRCGGPEEFLSEEIGSLVPPGDARALCEGLEAMLDSLHRYSGTQISQYAVERFSPDVVGAKLHAVYQSVLPK